MPGSDAESVREANFDNSPHQVFDGRRPLESPDVKELVITSVFLGPHVISLEGPIDP